MPAIVPTDFFPHSIALGINTQLQVELFGLAFISFRNVKSSITHAFTLVIKHIELPAFFLSRKINFCKRFA